MLVVQAADHPRNARYIPTPTLEPFAVDLQYHRPEQASVENFWFRAEVGVDGQVDLVSLLDTSGRLPRDLLEAAIRDNLSLEYGDEKRHRVVVFGTGSISPEGGLTVENGLVIESRCCGDCCYDHEFGIWLCPCPGN